MPPHRSHRPVCPSRRAFIGGALAAPLIATTTLRAAETPAIRAIAFDAFVVFNQTSVAARAEAMFPGKGAALFAQWNAKLFGYSWMETSAGRYDGFVTVLDRALAYAAGAMGLTLDDAARATLIGSYRELDLWDDVKPALERLRARGVRMALLSNFDAALLDAVSARTGLDRYFERPFSIDRVRAFKPARAAYQMGIDGFGLAKEQVAFAASGAWDAVGAHWFGYKTAWINRLGLPAEKIDVEPAIIAPGMDGVLKLAGFAN